MNKTSYDQDSIWMKLTKELPPNVLDVISKQVRKLADTERRCVVHILTDRPLTPQGNLLFHHVSTTLGSERLSKDHMVARNYDPLDDGRVRTIHDVPVSPHYRKFEIWGVDEMGQNALSSPIVLDPNRKGNPLFVDQGMIAFGAEFTDYATQEQISGSLLALIAKLQDKVDYMGDTIPVTGTVLNLEITPVNRDFWHKKVNRRDSSHL